MSRALVVGGGIAGLCAAYEFHLAGWDVELHEASNRFGGKIHSSPVGDRPVDAGPDAFLARVDDGIDLCRDLGLESDLTSPCSPVPAYIHTAGRLHPLPAKTLLGVPTDLDVLADSDLISAAGLAAAQADLEPTSAAVGEASETDPEPGAMDDLSVGAVCRARLGDEITDRLVDPLLGAINASDIDRLSIEASAPQLARALRLDSSLMRGAAKLLAEAAARSSRSAGLGTAASDQGPATAPPVFHGLPGGIATIIDRLVDALSGHDLRLDSPIGDLAAMIGSDRRCDAVVLAVPAPIAAELLSPHPEAAGPLSAIDYAGVTQVTVELPIDAVEPVLDASGILFPRIDGGLMTACTWLSTKWAHYRRDDSVLIRMSAGRFGDDRAAGMADGDLTDALVAELSSVIEVGRPPTAARVQRWPRSFPQYEPGHRGRVATARAALADADPRISLAGAAYDGIGIPACIASGRSAARVRTGR